MALAIVQEQRGFDSSVFLRAVTAAMAHFKAFKINVNLDENVFLQTVLKLQNFRTSEIVNMGTNYNELLSEWIGDKYQVAELLYSGATDGYSAVVYHKKCDNKGPTLTLVASNDDKVFGGFLSLSMN